MSAFNLSMEASCRAMVVPPGWREWRPQAAPEEALCQRGVEPEDRLIGGAHDRAVRDTTSDEHQLRRDDVRHVHSARFASRRHDGKRHCQLPDPTQHVGST
jgi:hypothetical protein